MTVISLGSHVTLHYRLAVLLGGEERELMSTLGGHPATLQLGDGQWAAPLEACLIGLAEGAQARFELAAGQAYGERNNALVQTLTRAAFEANAEAGEHYEAGEVVQFRAADGRSVAGVLKSISADAVVVDFNHPLAGLPVRLDVRVIGVL